MEYFIRSGEAARVSTGCLVIGVFSDGAATGPEQVSPAVKDILSGLRRAGDLPKKAGEHLLLPQPPGLRARRLLLIGCGERSKYCVKQYRQAVTAAARQLQKLGGADAVLMLAPAGLSAYVRARHAVEAAAQAWLAQARTSSSHAEVRLEAIEVLLKLDQIEAVAQAWLALAQDRILDVQVRLEATEALVKLDQSPSLAAQMTGSGMRFDHITLNHGRIRLKIQGEVALMRIELGLPS